MAGGRIVRRLAAIMAAGLVCGMLASTPRPQVGDDVPALSAGGRRRHRAGKYAQATEVAKRLLATYEIALGSEHLHVATSAITLAELYWRQGRYAEAEPLFKRSLGIREKALRPGHPDVVEALNNLLVLYQSEE